MNATTPLLPRVAQGDQGAVKKCIDTYGGLIWSVAKRLCPAQEAEDAVQEIFIDLWKNAGRFDAEKSSEKTFVVMIARRRLIDRLRQQKRRPEQVQLAETAEPAYAAGLEASADATRAHEAMNDMGREQRKVLYLSLHLGMSHGEIAETTGVALGTVKSHIRRGLATIREKLERIGKPKERRAAQ
ncbi:RNA polymerase sigma factor [Acanthopleuribacter pedis]|uniref:RNA polymerase sigma factor n=1 Tax=Acanthopleuribacter pedis TaxID=442870 RepID=A0A8J7U3N9_9BACT|nr:RNA polymerase sigma factor [Acanthopleuribacter pedis]MBO1317232.1 RNA polymerase sigma factor [Acanthopleuribacter pedis]MBO1318538.1 RNA polymerase sigma factor [Acanthopleuribacter pedis]